MNIINIAEHEAVKADGTAIERIEMDIGALSGIEMSALDFAWESATKDSMLQGAEKCVNIIPGKAACFECDNEFCIENYYDPCPVCKSHHLKILQGKEFKIRSLVITRATNINLN